jgi:hypothetical protein
MTGEDTNVGIGNVSLLHRNEGVLEKQGFAGGLLALGKLKQSKIVAAQAGMDHKDGA